MTRTTIARRGAALAAVAFVFSLALPAGAHDGHEHGAEARPVDIRLAPRFEARGDELEIVGVLAGETLLIYLDRADDNAPIQGARIEVEGQGIKGEASAMADGVYQLPAAALGQAGTYPLTLTVQAGEIVDLLSASLEVAAAAVAAPAAGKTDRRWWAWAGIPLFLFSGGLMAHRLRRQAKQAKQAKQAI